MTAEPGLSWLMDSNWAVGLVFVRGATEEEVFRAYGADPAQAVPRGPGEEGTGPLCAPTVRVGRAGDWLFAVEDGLAQGQGIRSEVLSRLSAGGEAVALQTDIGKFNHEFAYAEGGDVIAALTTCVPPIWSGSDPERLASLVREARQAFDDDFDDDDEDGELSDLEVLLALVASGFGLTLAPEDLSRALPCAAVLPRLAGLPRPLPAGHQYRGGTDPVLDLLVNRGDPAGLAAAAAVRLRRLMTATGLDADPALTAAAEAAFAGHPRPPLDDEPAGLALRRLARDQDAAELYRAVEGSGAATAPEEQLRAMIRRGDAARLLRFLFDGRPPAQLLAGELQVQRGWDSRGWQEALAWRPQALTDLAAVEVPAADRQAAENAWRAEPALLRGRSGHVEAGPVRDHVAALLAAGMDTAQVAALGRTSPMFLGRLLGGHVDRIPAHWARPLLEIPVP